MAYHVDFMRLSQRVSALTWPNSPHPATYLRLTEPSYRECLAIQSDIEALMREPLSDRLRPGVMLLAEAVALIRQAAEMGRDLALRTHL